MPKTFNMSRINSQIRQVQRQAERQIKSETSKATRKLESDINHELRKYGSKVRSNKQVITREMNRLRLSTAVHSSYTTSLRVMHELYQVVNNTYDESYVTPQQEHILELIEQEQANGLIMANVIQDDVVLENNTSDMGIGNKLQMVSEDLNNRWQGAIFALNPNNPDAARHFCTSAREIFTDFIEMKAPDCDVFEYNPQCDKTERGNATRREKIRFMMKDMSFSDSVIDFVEADITNILELFHILSDGTHGEAGRYKMSKLKQVKKRVEQGLIFLCEISA